MRDEVLRAVDVVKRGGLLLYPTDTVWGIGCDATNDEAVGRVYALKRSVNKHAMTILVRSMDEVSRYVRRVPEVAWALMEAAGWDVSSRSRAGKDEGFDRESNPLTLIFPGGVGVSDELIPDAGTIGIRVPKQEFCQALLHRLGHPLVSTSANLSGGATPSSFSEIPTEIRRGVDMIVSERLEGHPTRRPSSIIGLGSGGEVKIIRE